MGRGSPENGRDAARYGMGDVSIVCPRRLHAAERMVVERVLDERVRVRRVASITRWTSSAAGPRRIRRIFRAGRIRYSGMVAPA